MSNRAQRRAAAKATPRYKRGMTHDDKIKAFYKNGITVEDLQKNYEIGFENGRKAATDYTFKVCYAAFILAMKKQLHFGRERCRKILTCADDIVVETLSSDEAIEQVWNEIGLHLDFDDPFDRVREGQA